MENSWQVKCGSTLQSLTPPVGSSSSQELRNQTERNAGYDSYPHDPNDLSLKVLGTVQDPLFPNHPFLRSHKSGHVNLGNSFLALLSGPPSLLQCDFKDLSNSKLISDSNSVAVNAIGSGIPLTFSGLPSEYLSEQNLQLGPDFCPSTSRRAVAGSSCSSSSVLPGLQIQDLETTIIHRMVPGGERTKGSFPLSGDWHGSVPLNAGKVSSTKSQTSQMKSLEANPSIFNQSSSFLSDCPRVFCLDTGGYLLISNTGLLGIVCSCHCFHMSVLKFCEHSGLCGVNPGDAVRMDHGETIAQWRKLYFQKFGIRVPEDQSDWDWPEGLSATSGLMKSRTTLPNSSCNFPHLAHSSEGLLRSGQLLDNVMLSKTLHMDQNLGIDASQSKQKSNVQDGNSIALKSLTDISQSNMHSVADTRIMECPLSHCATVSKSVGSGQQDGCQSISAYIDSILKNGNSSISPPALQDLRTIGHKSDVSMFKDASNSVFACTDAALSNIELKLGQPYQSSQNPKNSDLRALGTQLLDTVVNQSKLFFPEQIIHNTADCPGKMEIGQSLYFAAGPCNPSNKREQNQLNLGNCTFEISNVNDAALLEKSRGNLAQNAVGSLLTNFNLLAENGVQIKPNDNVISGIEHTVPHTQFYEPRFAKFDQSNVPCYNGNGIERQLNVGPHELVDKGKGVKFVTEGSCFMKDSGSRNHEEIEISTYHPHVSAAQGSSCNLNQLSSVPMEAPAARKFSNHAENFPTFGSSLHVDHFNHRSLTSPVGSGLIMPSQVVTRTLPLATSTCVLNQIPALHREESTGVSPHLLDDNLRMLALRQILELSKQQYACSSYGMDKREGRYDSLAFLNHSVADSSAPGEPFYTEPNLTSGREVSEAAVRARLSGATGMNGCCDLSTLIQGIPINSGDPLRNEQPLMRHSRSVKNSGGPSEHEKGRRVSSTCFQCNCNCSVHKKCFEMNLESTVGSFPSPLKEQTGMVNGEASVFFHPKFSKNHIISNDEIISLDQGGKLNGELPKNVVTHASQWRDVPSKVKEVSRVMCRDTPAKCNNGILPVMSSIKEHETSNISSGSSAPAVTQLSVEVNNMDCSSADAGNTGCVSTLVDEGSGIDKCWSSDDARGSEGSAESLGDTCKTSLKESGSSKNSNRQSSRSLLDELKLINSLTWKKGRKQIQNEITTKNKDNFSNMFDRHLKKGKRKRDFSSLVHYEISKQTDSAEFPSSADKSMQMLSLSSQVRNSGACSNQHNSENSFFAPSSVRKPSRKRELYKLYNDKEVKDFCWAEIKASNCEIPEAPTVKKFKRGASNGFRPSLIQEKTHDGGRMVKKYHSKGCVDSSLVWQANTRHCKSRPIVCGKYGELSDRELVGDISKPAKIVPLSRVLKSAKRCTLPNESMLTLMKELKKTENDGTNGCYDEFHHLDTEKESGSHDAAVCGKTNHDASLEKMKNRVSCRDNKFAEELSMSETHDRSKKDHEENSTAHAQLKPRPKEIRKRSIYELTVDGKSPHQKTFSLSKRAICFPEMTEGTLVRNGEDRKHGLCKVAEKSSQERTCSSLLDSGSFCCVCGSSNKDEINYLLQCNRCLIKVHQACYGVSRVPKGHWYCRPCRTSSRNIVCVLCGYGGGAMTQALRSHAIVKSLLRVWNVETECKPKNKLLSVKNWRNSLSTLDSSGSGCKGGTSFPMFRPENTEPLASTVCKMDMSYHLDVIQDSPYISKLKVDNSITAGLLDSTTKQWIHMVCGLWTPGTRCPNVDTMSAFDVSGAPRPRADVVCSICSRPGGSCIKCRNLNCSVQFHAWCAHEKGLLQSELEGVDNESVGFYGRCVLHATHPMYESDCKAADGDRLTADSEVQELTCAKTEGYKGRKRDGFCHTYNSQPKGKGGCHVPQEQLNAWIHINGQKPCTQGLPKVMTLDIEHDCRKEYTRYKQARGGKHLVVYKSGIHALGLYTSRFISRGEMVVEYIGEIVGLRVADKRENEYQTERKLQYKSACYFFRIDKEHIIDATRKGGIARFVNHSCLPNCVAKVISIRNEKKVVFFAERDIFPGEEITYDYHFNHEDEGKKIPCLCNSKNCRRYLN